MTAKTINPLNGEMLFEAQYISEKELEDKILIASKAYKIWKNISFQERASYMRKLANLMNENREELARLNVIEMGMLYKDALGDISKSVSNILYFADNAELLLKTQYKEEGGVKATIMYEPKGLLYIVSPWNYPFNQAIRSTIPNLMAGNVILLKHASNLPQVTIMLNKLFLDAGFPEGVFNSLLIPSHFSEKIISNNNIIGVAITGGDKAGRSIGELAGKYLKPSVLELGGNDSFIVLDNNDLDKIVTSAISGRFSNAGQKCNSSKRFIVLEKYYDEFISKLKSTIENMVVGDPMDEKTQIGPLARKEAVIEIDSMVKESLNLGAKIACGGSKLENNGYFYLPTLVYDVKEGMPLFDDEIFGPVASVIKAKNIDEVISLANNSRFGLGASLFGDNVDDLKYVASKLEVSNIAINKVVTSYAFLPYGGIKDSGYGKELGESGIKTFCNQKVIVE